MVCSPADTEIHAQKIGCIELCGGAHTALREVSTPILITFCSNLSAYVSVTAPLCLGGGQCKRTIGTVFSLLSQHN